MVGVAAYTGGRSVPSARFRLRQYIPLLKDKGIEITEYYPRLGAYPPANILTRPPWAVGLIAERMPSLVHSWCCDLTFLQREMMSSHFTLEGLTGRPRVLDVDDAIWLNRGNGFASRLAMRCDAVICGNNYLAEWFQQWNPNVSVLPTAIDTAYFKPTIKMRDPEGIVIGWCGTSSGFRSLYSIQNALGKVLERNTSVRLRIVSDIKPLFTGICAERLDYVPWTEIGELHDVQEMTIGIMPLNDTPWERGKCSFKMLMYMSCGIPVVVSPVGMNAEVIGLGDVGFAAETDSQWAECIEALILDRKLRARLGEMGRKVVEEHFSLATLGTVLSKRLHEIAGIT